MESTIDTFKILSPGPITFCNRLPRLTAVIKIPGSPGTTGLSLPPLIFNPRLPSLPAERKHQVMTLGAQF